MKKTFFLSLILSLIFFVTSNVFATSNYVDKTINFLKDSKVFYLATTTNGTQPKVRPFGAVLNIDGEINFCTGKTKNVYKQIKNNPRVEVVATNKDRWIRITGRLIANTTEKTKTAFFKEYPELKKAYSGKEKELVIFKLNQKASSIVINSLNGEQEVLK
ncbi:MAG: pyridoxamine 5'-phosphate oxidase family protein [Rickettsiales bacterium]|jgi:uncharacterized pyridoxamine 5'-phosphate oxidase family protein|nr:pyridoxamine 5'-phosphate oxidase family protein [Rickettsiales bacterium]